MLPVNEPMLLASESDLIESLAMAAVKIGENAINKQFRVRGTMLNFGERISLIHSELGEATEWDRKGNPPSDHIPQFSGVEEELADVVIRALDLADERGWSLGAAIVAKMRYNAIRPIKHGGKKY